MTEVLELKIPMRSTLTPLPHIAVDSLTNPVPFADITTQLLNGVPSPQEREKIKKRWCIKAY